jgi:hypothetical protein
MTDCVPSAVHITDHFHALKRAFIVRKIKRVYNNHIQKDFLVIKESIMGGIDKQDAEFKNGADQYIYINPSK